MFTRVVEKMTLFDQYLSYCLKSGIIVSSKANANEWSSYYIASMVFVEVDLFGCGIHSSLELHCLQC